MSASENTKESLFEGMKVSNDLVCMQLVQVWNDITWAKIHDKHQERLIHISQWKLKHSMDNSMTKHYTSDYMWAFKCLIDVMDQIIA